MTHAAFDEPSDAFISMPTGVGEVTISRHWPFRLLLATRLFGTDFEFGELHFPEVDTPIEQTPDGLGTRYTVHQMSLVMHPLRGVLVVKYANIEPNPSDPTKPAERLAGAWRRLNEDFDILVRELTSPVGAGRDDAPHPFWTVDSLPVGRALITKGPQADLNVEALGVDPQCLVDGSDWTTLPGKLGRTMDDNRSGLDVLCPAQTVYAASAIKGLGHPPGGYFDHVRCLDTLDRVKTELFDRNRRAA